MAADQRWHGATHRAVAVIAMAALCWLAVPVPGATQSAAKDAAIAAKTEPSDNPYNDELLRMTPDARAAKLASFLGGTCIGTKPFLMGVTKAGKARGYAYWNVECAGGKAYMIQLTPDGAGAAIDCRTLKQGGEGRECYKAF